MSIKDIFKKIKEFFLSLFSSSGDDFKNQKATKALISELKKAKYPLYRTDNTVLAGLPIIIYELFIALLPLRQLLLSTIASNDVRISASFIDLMVEDKFTEDERNVRESLRFENRVKAIPDFLSPDFDKILKKQNSAFNDFSVALNSPKFDKIDDIVNKCYAFFDFTNFKFNAFFSHFDSGFQKLAATDSVREHYNFESVQGSRVLQDILDMNFLLQRVCVDEDFVRGIFFLNAKLPEKFRREESLLKRDLHNFTFIVENNLGRNSLRNLSKLIKQDPLFEDNAKAPVDFSAIQDYKERIISVFSADTKRLLNMQQDEKLADLIAHLFQGIEMLSLKFYNQKLNERVQNLTVLSLDWVKPIEIIFTFTKRFFEPNFEPFLRELIVEGYFEDKNFQTELASDYYFCEAIPDRLKEFEELTDEKKEHSELHITGFLARIENGGEGQKALSQSLDFLNLKAKEMVEDIAKRYAKIYKACELIVEDSHRSVPKLVSNLKAMIISTRNKDKFSTLEKGMDKFNLFLDILKKYVIIETLDIKNNIQEQ